MVSTVSWDDEVAHKTCCFDLHLFARSRKLRIFLTLYHERGSLCGPITHWTAWLWPSIMISTVSWDDEVVHKTCCFDLDLFARSQKLINFLTLYHERGSRCGHHNYWTAWHWPSIMVSTVSNDDVVCAQDLLLWPWPWPFFDALKGHKQLRDSFPLFTMDAQLNAGGFDSVGVTL